jgi:hypothetical protein
MRPFVAIAVTAVGMYFAPYLAPLWGGISGFISTGSVRGTLVGAFSAMAFSQVGAAFQKLAQSTRASLQGLVQAGKVLAHGAVGGVMSYLNGGQFGHGFAAAGFTQAFAGPIGSIDGGNVGFSVQRTMAAAVVGGTASELTGGKFANGAVTGAFSRAFNDELHPFIQKAIRSLQEQKFWREFADLSPPKFRLIFPSLTIGMNDFDLKIVQLGLYDEFYRSELPSQILDTAHAANDLLREYTIGRVWGIVVARGQIATILGRSAGLTDGQVGLVKDAFAIKAFADQQGVNISQLNNLAGILIQNNQTIDEAILNLQQ